MGGRFPARNYVGYTKIGGGGVLIVLLGWGPNRGWISRIMVVPIVPYPWWKGGGAEERSARKCEREDKVNISQKYR